MFVKDNTLASIKAYFFDRLADKFSSRELELMFREFALKRMQISSTDYLMASSLKLSESDLLFFRSMVKELKNDKPFQHLLGTVEFFGFEFKVDSRALIPRPETEELVKWILEDADRKFNSKIVDYCTGSGCIAIALKLSLENAEVYGVDLSLEALELAKENNKKLGAKVDFVQHDVLKEIDFDYLRNLDVIVSNPPYIPESDRERMHQNVLDHEPEMALFVPDNNALLFYERISSLALEQLNQNGLLYFEIHEDLSTETERLLVKKGFINVEIKKDLQGKNRMIKAQKG